MIACGILLWQLACLHLRKPKTRASLFGRRDLFSLRPAGLVLLAAAAGGPQSSPVRMESP